VLANLLSNAVKFTNEGRIEISITGQPALDGKFEIHFAIKDTGIGIPEDKLDRLFQSFSQIDSSTTRKYGGTGLGLAISKRLVEMMGGKIWVESVEGIGSTFHFTIVTEAATLEKDHFAAVTPEPKQRMRIGPKLDRSMPLRILLAEDNAVNQMVALQMLKRLGYSADVATNGLEVLQALERQQYDVVLMDIQMPEMDGIAAARKIRERWPKGPKIIAITAYALEGDREKCLKAGMDNYIAKPIQIEELRSVLDICE
jgi:CheY-like chemotaxis protein